MQMTQTELSVKLVYKYLNNHLSSGLTPLKLVLLLQVLLTDSRITVN